MFISTDQLFHYTTFENLPCIIENGFYPRYNFEYTFLSDLFPSDAAILAIPMVCFCDIPLSLISSHADKYGKVAIGLKKEWGTKNGINPIFYINPNSVVGDAISVRANAAKKYNSRLISEDSDHRIFNILSTLFKSMNIETFFLKPYEYRKDLKITIGNKKHVVKKGRYYDEREWRYVPFHKAKFRDIFLTIEHFNDEEKLSVANKKLQKFRLEFGIKDIDNIVVENQNQVELITEVLKKKFGSNLRSVEIIEFKNIEKQQR